MSHFVSKETQHIELGDGDWAELRALTFGDRRAIEARMFRIRLNGGEINTQEDLDYEAGNLEMLRRVVAAWGGAGFECSCGAKASPHAAGCSVRPITEENLLGLDTVGDLIFAKVSDMLAGQASPKAPVSSELSGGATSAPKKATRSKRPTTH